MAIKLASAWRGRAAEIVFIATDKFLQGLCWGAGLVAGFMAVLWLINVVGGWLS